MELRGNLRYDWARKFNNPFIQEIFYEKDDFTFTGTDLPFLCGKN